MKIEQLLPVLSSTVVLATLSPSAFGQTAVDDHVQAARTSAGADWQEVADFFCVEGAARTPSTENPLIEPTQLFDNLYAIGRRGNVVYAITTTEGIVLIDSGYPGQEESVLLTGLAELGLDPNDIEYVIIAHGHADHYGGAALLQSRFGARIAVGAQDWGLMERAAQSGDTPPQPTRDLEVRDGEPIVLGDTAITPTAVPGHTPGSLGLIFPVRDSGNSHVAALFGGTILLSGRISDEGLDQYIESLEHFGDVATEMGVDVEIQNHPLFDGMPEKLARLDARRAGDPHPFVLTHGSYQRFTRVIANCTRAELARRATR
jgi:metallo-beta-lactamase class B